MNYIDIIRCITKLNMPLIIAWVIIYAVPQFLNDRPRLAIFIIQISVWYMYNYNSVKKIIDIVR